MDTAINQTADTVQNNGAAPERTRGKRRARPPAADGGSRTSQACEVCRRKKVRCDGQWPCQYCVKRHLNCVFGAMDKRKMYSVSEIRDLKCRVAQYEGQGPGHTTQQIGGVPSPVSTSIRNHSNSPSVPIYSPKSNRTAQTGLQNPVISPSNVPPDGSVSCASITVSKSPATIAPDSALSSTENFGSEIRSILVSRKGNQPQGESPPYPIATIDSLDTHTLLRNLPGWPSLEESQEILDLVVLNVGISQQLFDVRLFSDNLYQLYQEPGSQPARQPISWLWVVEALIVMAVGRLLQARPCPGEEVPGASLFKEATKLLPRLLTLKEHGILGIEVVALTALYLQIADRKEEAYVQASLALHLAVARGMHKVGSDRGLSRSEAVHRNRLWWSIYMQQRQDIQRLSAMGGFPMAIHDETITIDAPTDAPGFSPARAIAMNLKAAKITGQINWTIYTKKGLSELSFIEDVQNIFHSIDDLERNMPAEYVMDIDQGSVHVGGLEFAKSAQPTARTSSSLYLSIYQAFIHAGRPILLFMARKTHETETEAHGYPSPSLRRLAEVCVQAASKSLLILQELCERGIIAKHAFLDLDAVFSAGFVFVLVEMIVPGRNLGACGIRVSRRILSHLVELGNRAASRRLTELDQMCAHLGACRWGEESEDSFPTLSQMFTFEHGYGSRIPESRESSDPLRRNTQDGELPNDGDQFNTENQVFPTNIPSLHLDGPDFSLGEEDGISWVFQPGMYTGEELADWEMFESQILTADLS